jgi:hypothetical protein
VSAEGRVAEPRARVADKAHWKLREAEKQCAELYSSLAGGLASRVSNNWMWWGDGAKEAKGVRRGGRGDTAKMLECAAPRIVALWGISAISNGDGESGMGDEPESIGE